MDTRSDLARIPAVKSVRELTRIQSHELLTVNWLQVQPALTAFLRASTPQFSDAEDLLQEVAVEVARRFDDYDPTRPFLPWVTWIAKLKIADFYRARNRVSVKFVEESLDLLVETCDQVPGALIEERPILKKCLAQLTGRSRELIQLRYQQDFTPQQIAAKVNMTSGAVRTALSRIRSVLLDCIQANAST